MGLPTLFLTNLHSNEWSANKNKNGGETMSEINEKNVPDITTLSNELTYRRYLMNKGKVREFFDKMSIPEYIALHHIASESEMSSIYGGKT